jgi:hypothetical protein
MERVFREEMSERGATSASASDRIARQLAGR